MQVNRVTPYLIHPGWGKNWLYVKVETDEGLTGWGEAYTQIDRDTVVSAMVDELGRHLLGRDPFHIKQFTAMAFNDFALRRGSLEFYSALSGIEIALWDIVGKAAGQPVYNLLGGPCRDRIRVYANGWYKGARTPADHARAAEEVVAAGFGALKFDPFPGPFRSHISRADEDFAVACVAAVREAVGPRVDVLVEVHRRLAPVHAKRVAARLEPYDPFWFEEPCPAENLPEIREVRASTRIPIVTGEALYGKAAFRAVFELGAADIVNPDVANTGGILELKEIAAMAEPYQVAVSPHNFNSTAVGLAATLHASAVMPNFLIAEYFTPFEEVSRELAPNAPVPEGGYLALPTGPGLGIAIDEEALARHAYRRFPQRSLPTFRDERS
ncbi:MAG: mandelate racemase/muconate lactonizing enzyme family protein [SAR324 cluster bacterium]|nr:mandelate racemase/muconate lactonizing enzyme family protein [SAR324 cluster bacterium]